jgi:predicted nucleotidyltransferase
VNLSRPFEAVVPTLDGAVLVTLAKLSSPMTGRRVHQLAGVGSEAGVRNVLNRLVDQGIVRAHPAGSAYLYGVNREHVAWAAVTALAGLRAELLSRLVSEFGTWELRARCAALFGSAARGEGDEDSDIDILVLHTKRADENTDTWQAQLDRLRELVHVWTGNDCQLYDIQEDEILRMIAKRDPLLAEWRRDAVPLAGTDIRNLLRDLGYRTARSKAKP